MGMLDKLRARRGEPPPGSLPPLGQEEYVVAWAQSPLGVVAATSLGLWWPSADGPRRIGWHLIDKATWQDGVLSVTEAEEIEELLLLDRRPLRVALTEPRDLPPAIRKRVEASIVHNEQVAVGGGTARIVARHVPGRDGVQWRARLSSGATDNDDVRSALSNRIALLRADWERTHG